MTVAESPALSNIVQVLPQLTEQLMAPHDHAKRMELLKQMRIALAEADKIKESETGNS